MNDVTLTVSGNACKLLVFPARGRKDDGHDMGKMVSEDGKQKGRKTDGADRNVRSSVGWKGYVSPTLTQAEKRNYVAWAKSADQVQRQVSQFPKDGYKISFDYMERERAYRASAYCTNSSSQNAGYCLTIWAKDWWEAIMRLVFVHYEILGSDWTPLTHKSEWKDDWLE